MATLELREGERVEPATVRALTAGAVQLNVKLGDPTKDARPGRR